MTYHDHERKIAAEQREAMAAQQREKLVQDRDYVEWEARRQRGLDSQRRQEAQNRNQGTYTTESGGKPGLLEILFGLFIIGGIGASLLSVLGIWITDQAVAQGINRGVAREIGNIPVYITVIVILAMALYALWKHRRLILTGAAILLFIGGGIYAYASTRPDAPATAPAQRGQAAPASSFVSDTTATVTTDELNLRPEPGVGHGTVDLLYEGEQVELLGEVRQVGSATWVKVRAGGAIGWVNAGYLE
jgi:hypothetical protein